MCWSCRCRFWRFGVVVVVVSGKKLYSTRLPTVVLVPRQGANQRGGVWSKSIFFFPARRKSITRHYASGFSLWMGSGYVLLDPHSVRATTEDRAALLASILLYSFFSFSSMSVHQTVSFWGHAPDNGKTHNSSTHTLALHCIVALLHMHDVGNQQIFCNTYLLVPLLPLGDIVTCSMPITATVSSPSINDNRRKWAINHWIIRSESLITYDREGGTVIVRVHLSSLFLKTHSF